jgi:hypothetical protein
MNVPTTLAASLTLAAATLFGARQVEARRDRTAAALLAAAYATQDLASALVACSDETHKLPPTSRKVPGDVPRGLDIPTSDADWDDVAFRCADYHPVRAGFQLQWSLLAMPTRPFLDTEGAVIALVDVDGDGRPDHTVKTMIGCAQGLCEIAPSVDIERLP